MNPDWITPDWPAPARVKAVCTTRAGGFSKAPFDSLNLGDHVGDVAADVAKNRIFLADAIKAKPVFLSQVHGTKSIDLSGQTTRGVQADACLTQHKGIACTIMVADCLPVLFTNRAGDFVAAAHAGWRGLAGLTDLDSLSGQGAGGPGVLESIFQQIIATTPGWQAHPAPENIAKDLLVWLGPCIGAQQFEVGGEVRDAFVAQDANASSHFRARGQNKWLADLQGLARQRLAALGIRQINGNDGSLPWCTVSNPSRFFSHRRDSLALGGSGRMAACIWLD